MKRIVLLVMAGLALSACGSSEHPPAAAPEASGSWPYPNGDLANTRDAPGSRISSADVSRLRRAWAFKLSGAAASGVSGYGALAAAPIVENGVVYMQDLDTNVYALALSTGKLKWRYRVGSPGKIGLGPDGVAVVDGTVYGDSPTKVFALNATTGRPIWIDDNLLNSGQGSFDIQPQVDNGDVYLASAYGSGPDGGVLFALKASTGRLLWRFNTLHGADAGVRSGGLGSGGAWETPLINGDGSVTFGIGNPYQSAASAIANPSRQLYSDSDVNLDAATGKLRWYYQGVPNDFKDYDMQASPITARINGVSMVIGAGKMGYVYAMEATDGQLIWKTPVGEHNGHDDDSLRALEHRSTLKAPYSILPGSLGGVLSNMAAAGTSVYVTTVNLKFTARRLNDVVGGPSGSATGDAEALNLSTGKVEWDTKVSRCHWAPPRSPTISCSQPFTTEC